jgi:hypothetical protein
MNSPASACREFGIFTRVVDELELFRVKDYSMGQPFSCEWWDWEFEDCDFGCDDSIVTIEAVAQVEQVREKLAMRCRPSATANACVKWTSMNRRQTSRLSADFANHRL